jgi:hypothetical protein
VTATHQHQPNKALPPTAYSLRFGRSSRRSGFRRRVSLVVSLLGYLQEMFIKVICQRSGPGCIRVICEQRFEAFAKTTTNYEL